MRNNIRFLTAALAAVFCFCCSTMVAYAGGGGDTGEEPVVTETQAEPTAEPEPNPFTPDGTGTVVDNATDSDGKEFFTITTEAGNTFYLIIDRQRNSENVYFLNAVTEADLMALAEKSGEAVTTPAAAEPPVASEPAPEPAPEPTPEPETPAKSGGSGGLVFILIAAVAAGGAGWYFKVYKPKQQAVDPDEEFEDEYEDGDYEDGFDGDGANDDEEYEYYPSDDEGDDPDAGSGEPDYTEEE